MATKRGNGENSIYRSGGRWHVQGYLHGRRRRTSGTTRAQAVARWEELERATPADPAAAEIRTVAEALQQWYTLNAHRWRYSTAVGYRGCIDRHLTPALGALPIAALDVRRVDNWQHDLLAAGLSTSTVRQARIVLKQTYDMLARYGAAAANPVTAAAALPKHTAKTDFLTTDEARRVIAAADTAQGRARWLLALSLGMRCGEVLGLRWEDINLAADQPRLTVSGSLQFQSGKGLVLVPPKTSASVRTIPLGPAHADALRAVRLEQNRNRILHGPGYNVEGFVFITSAGTPIDPRNDQRAWRDLLRQAGVRQVRRHDARHTAATLLLDSGASLAHIQKTLGHTTIRTTVDIYGHLTADDSAAYTSAIAAQLTG